MTKQSNTSEARRPLEQGTFYLFGNLIRPYDIPEFVVDTQGPQSSQQATMNRADMGIQVNGASMVTGGAKDANIVATVNENPKHIEAQNDDGDGEDGSEITPSMEIVLEDIRIKDNLNLVGRCVSKVIDNKRHIGWVAAYDTQADMFTVMYEHSIVEEMDPGTLEEHLPTVPEIQNYFAERLHRVHQHVEPQGARPVATMVQATSRGQDQRVESSQESVRKTND